ncbi:substrate-binding domain-containing protein [[Mycoplasma] imitans]|uniref:substrate-binding domain-containing protein n=1 Tax=[Mycoplasma] imitans TaxID=29560 RepID=UPI000480BFB1|nr:substrate-binding domain-containing protein [[Mycoplasma] imitans]
MKPFFKKKISLFFSTVSLSYLMSSCSLNFVVINTRGSSAVQPFMDALSELYAKYAPVEISVQAGGSTTGIISVLDGTTNIGNASKSPRDQILANHRSVQEWKDLQVKTVTLAKDAIAIIYKKPANTSASDFYLDANNIDKMYDAFAGYDTVSLSDFYFGKNLNGNYNVVPFARAGGASVSGTAEAFLHNSGLIKDDQINKKTLDALKGKIDYGSHTITTGESNIETYNFFKTNARLVGSMTYLSLGFIINNLTLIKNDGFDLLNYKVDDKVIVPSIQSVSDGDYRWIRPYNSIFSLSNKDESRLNSIKQFIKFILFDNKPDVRKRIEDIYQAQGLITLSDKDLKKMFLLNDGLKNMSSQELIQKHEDAFWVSDYSFDPVRFGVEF